MNVIRLIRRTGTLSRSPSWHFANSGKAPCYADGSPFPQWTRFGAPLSMLVRVIAHGRTLGVVGVGVVLSLRAARRLVALDFDKALDGNTAALELARRLAAQAPTYFERSISGRGLHAVYYAPEGIQPISVRSASLRVEIYHATPRFLIMTGERPDGFPDERVRPIPRALLDALIAELGGGRFKPTTPPFVALERGMDVERDSLAARVASAPEGTRNETLFSVARLLAEKRIPLNDAMLLLVPAAMKAGLSADEARATIFNAYRRREKLDATADGFRVVTPERWTRGWRW